ncbi:MAG: proline iminopeptidase-family hydrolase [Gammaproteobacteria bacterium]|jgi:proline iminopeptidase|nr:proline iminopeptidase-family hydrolase [Gammaproteobacteria bacterium]MBT4494964.1 proline iminopeptidase-family hydrolase [Gammaproteobacteria bacterium]MBT7370688.1 proline iminopeptidase-family hydrolase [Gammaproteobacteria bacterium]
MPYIEHRYGRTFYQSRGNRRSKGLPIVCLHGGPGGHSRFMSDLFKLSDERRVFVYDQIGGGRSSITDKNRWTVPTFVNELKYLVDAWELDRFHLFGASWGTTLALEYYLSRKKNRVESLIFQSPMFSARDWQDDANMLIDRLPAEVRKVIRYCHEIGATDSKVYQDAMSTYYARHVCRNKARVKRSVRIKNPNGEKVYEYMWGASEFSATGTLKNYDRVSDLDRIQSPTLFLCGEHDEARPSTARGYTRKIADARFEKIDGASHAILSEKPGQLIRRIRHFVRQVEHGSN